jgi:hypothetical protein
LFNVEDTIGVVEFSGEGEVEAGSADTTELLLKGKGDVEEGAKVKGGVGGSEEDGQVVVEWLGRGIDLQVGLFVGVEDILEVEQVLDGGVHGHGGHVLVGVGLTVLGSVV